MMSAMEEVKVEVFDFTHQEEDIVITLARAFNVATGDTKVAIARAMLALLNN